MRNGLSMHSLAADASPRVLVVSASIGAGHDGAANELSRRCLQRGYAVERLDFLDLLPLGSGHLMRALYHLQLRVSPKSWGWLHIAVKHRRSSGWSSIIFASLCGRRLSRRLTAKPHFVLSTYPLASQALGALRTRGLITCPVATFLTDMSVHPLWVSSGVDAHLALHDVAARQARQLQARGVQVVGPVVSPRFRPGTPSEQAAARNAFGLPAEGPLVLVVAGAWGVGDIDETVDDVLATGLATPVVVCGVNAALQRRLSGRPDVVSLGWVPDMPTLMWACDALIQNAGGLSSLEGRACGLHVITYRCLAGHGVTNADALEQAGWSTWVKQPNALASQLATALSTRSVRAPQHPVESRTPALVPALVAL